MKYTFTFHGDAESDGAAVGREKIVLESRAGESDRHIALKTLAYGLFRGETGGLPLRIEQGVGQRHKPDLVATDPETGRARLWIDCGQIETKRLGRIVTANPQARVVVVKATLREAIACARAAERRLPPARTDSSGSGGRRRRENDDEPEAADTIVSCIGFDEEFLPAFLLTLRGVNDVTITRQSAAREEPALRVLLNGVFLMTGLYRVPIAAAAPEGKPGRTGRT